MITKELVGHGAGRSGRGGNVGDGGSVGSGGSVGAGGTGGGAGAGGAGAPLGDGEPGDTCPESLKLGNGRVGTFARAVVPGIALGSVSGGSASAALLGEAGSVVATDDGGDLRSKTSRLSVPWSLPPREPMKRATLTGAASAAATATAAPTMYALCADLPLLLGTRRAAPASKARRRSVKPDDPFARS